MSTPNTTPSRRRPLPETPGSARSSTSNTTLDRGSLSERVEELDLQVHDLRRQIALERQRRHRARSSSTTLTLSYMDPSGQSAQAVTHALKEKLKEMDDDALTALLTASSGALARLIGGDGGAAELLGLEMVPSKSVGVEAVGSASEVDRRLLVLSGEGQEGRSEVQGEMVQSWLTDRQSRLDSLLSHLKQFTLLDMDTLNTKTLDPTRRQVRLTGNIARLFPLEVAFDIVEDAPSTGSSPQIQNLSFNLPSWLTDTLNTPHKLYTRLLRRNDLPGILLMLRTMVPLVSLRRNLFTSLMQTYTSLAREHVKDWETLHGDFIPYHPPSSSSSTNSSRQAKSSDEKLARSLILPSAAEAFTLTNNRGASLTIRFGVRWNRFGHAYPELGASSSVPRRLLNPASTAFLRGFEQEVQHLLKVALDEGGMVGFADQDEDELADGLGRWGVTSALTAVIKGFFRLDVPASDAESQSD